MKFTPELPRGCPDPEGLPGLPTAQATQPSRESVAGSVLSAHGLAKRAASGAAFMIVRQFVSLGLTMMSGIVLARALTPAEFGAVALLTLLVSAAGIITDLGLSASMVHQSELPSTKDANGVVTAQMVVTALFVGVLGLSLPVMSRWDSDVANLRGALALGLLAVLVMPLSSVAFALLESRLQFRAVGAVLVAQSVVFAVVASGLTLAGWGIVGVGLALALANLVAGIAGAWSAKWLPRLCRPNGDLPDRLRFGIPYIASSGISVLKDSVMPIFLGLMFGAAAVGYVKWAQALAVSGMLILFPLARVFFPVFVRVRGDEVQLDSAVVRATFWSYAIAAPITLFVIANVYDITEVIYGSQWLPAVEILLWLTFANLLAPAVNVLFVLLNAQGHPSVTFRYTVGYFVATWVLVPIAAFVDSYRGYGWANVLVTLVGVPLIVRMRKHYFGHARDMIRPWAAGLGAVLLGRLAGSLVDSQEWQLAVSGTVGVVSYIVILPLVAHAFVGELWTLRQCDAPR